MSQLRDFRDFKKQKLSASDSGRAILVAATSSGSADLIHTAIASTASNEWDEIYLQAMNTSTSAVKLTVLWGGTNSEDQIEITIPAESGLVEVVNGNVLQNAKTVKAFAATTNVIAVHGYVNRYERTQMN